MEKALVLMQVCKIANAYEQRMSQLIVFFDFSEIFIDVPSAIEIYYSLSFFYHQLIEIDVLLFVEVCESLEDLLFKN